MYKGSNTNSNQLPHPPNRCMPSPKCMLTSPPPNSNSNRWPTASSNNQRCSSSSNNNLLMANILRRSPLAEFIRCNRSSSNRSQISPQCNSIPLLETHAIF